MSRQESWRDVAFALAARLSWAACDEHPASHPLLGCPFCLDRSAYARFVRKNGEDPWREAPSESIPIHELANNPTARFGAQG